MYVAQPYDDALRFILDNGELRKNRTGVDCLTVFGHTCRYRVSEFFPLLTRRRLFPKAVFAELLWMLSGNTCNDDLVRLGANFWTPWADPGHPESAAFYERTGFPPGMLGPVYGWQMRHFGADYSKWIVTLKRKQHNPSAYVGAEEEVLSEGFDQISWLVNEIKTNPDSRRLIVSLWNPKDLPLMRLPPCHYAFQIDTDADRRMSLLLHQRSCDYPVGVPANIQFYTTLLYLLCQQTGCTPHNLIHEGGNCHIYVDQLDAVREYLRREPPDSPRLSVRKADDIFSYRPSDFEVVGYDPHPAIKMPVAV